MLVARNVISIFLQSVYIPYLLVLLPGPLFFQPYLLPALIIFKRALVIFKAKLCTKIIVEDKYFTTLILFPCLFIHVKRK